MLFLKEEKGDTGMEHFNCLFCYCPLYVLGKECGGNFVYLQNGNKDCSRCLYPHMPDNYGKITARYREIVEAMNFGIVGKKEQ